MIEIRIPNSFEVALARRFGARTSPPAVVQAGILVAALLALGWLIQKTSRAAGEGDVALIVIVVLVAIRQGFGMLPSTRRRAARRLDARMTGELLYRIDDDGISCSDPAGETSIRWSPSLRFGRREGCVVLQEAGSIVAIPVLALDSEARERIRKGIGPDRWDRSIPTDRA